MGMAVRVQMPCLSQDVATTSIRAHNVEHVYVSGDNQVGDGRIERVRLECCRILRRCCSG
jgi:hypothetical protein